MATALLMQTRVFNRKNCDEPFLRKSNVEELARFEMQKAHRALVT
jgi:hypothetical protein